MPPFHDTNNRIADDELLDIVMFGIPKSWTKEMDKQDFDPFAHNMARLVDFCERLESAEDFHPEQVVKNNKGNKKAKTQKGSSNSKDGMWCAVHKTTTHNTDECDVVKRAQKSHGSDKKHFKNKTWKRKSDDAKSYTKKEIASIAKKAARQAERRVTKELNAVSKRSSSGSESDDSDDESIGSLNAIDATMASVDQQLADFEEKISRFTEQGVQVIAASSETLEKAKETAEKAGLSYPVAYGLNPEEFAAQFGAFYSDDSTYLHATGSMS